jgi:hypothetical protein
MKKVAILVSVIIMVLLCGFIGYQFGLRQSDYSMKLSANNYAVIITPSKPIDVHQAMFIHQPTYLEIPSIGYKMPIITTAEGK